MRLLAKAHAQLLQQGGDGLELLLEGDVATGVVAGPLSRVPGVWEGQPTVGPMHVQMVAKCTVRAEEWITVPDGFQILHAADEPAWQPYALPSISAGLSACFPLSCCLDQC